MAKYNLVQSTLNVFSSGKKSNTNKLNAAHKGTLRFFSHEYFKYFSDMSLQYYDSLLRQRKDSFIFVVPFNLPDKKFILHFYKIYSIFKEKMDFKICIISKLECKILLKSIGSDKFKDKSTLFAFVSKPTSDEVFFFDDALQLKSNNIIFNGAKMSDFVDKALTSKIEPEFFSENVKNKKRSKIKNVSFNSLKSFVSDFRKKISVVLYYDSRKCSVPCDIGHANSKACLSKFKEVSNFCKRLLKNFKSVASRLNGVIAIKTKLINWGVYDIGKNHHQSLRLAKAPFIRMYINKSMTRYSDIGIEKDPSKMYSKLFKTIEDKVPFYQTEL